MQNQERNEAMKYELGFEKMKKKKQSNGAQRTNKL